MLFHAHSGLRYLVLLFGAVALINAIAGLVMRRPYDRRMQILGMTFAGTLHLQVILGIMLLFSGRGFAPILMGHIIMMLFAAAAVQVPLSVMKRRSAAERSYMPVIIGMGVGLLFIVGGILAIGRPVFGGGTG